MKLWTLWCVVAVAACPAQQLSVRQFKQIARVCVPEANLADLVAIARTESDFNPWALSVNRPAALARKFGYASGRVDLHHQPRTREEAVRWARELSASGITVSVGLLQVNAERTGYSTKELLDPCTNLKRGWSILAAAYRQEVRIFGPGQRSLLAALGTYNAGSPAIGLRNGYVFSILRNAY